MQLMSNLTIAEATLIAKQSEIQVHQNNIPRQDKIEVSVITHKRNFDFRKIMFP